MSSKHIPCKNFASGSCRFGDRCHFLHSAAAAGRSSGGAGGRSGGTGEASGTKPKVNVNVDGFVESSILVAARLIARQRGYKETYHNEASKVVSFCDAQRTVRVNVYYTTRTVGTSLSHPRQGKTQLFRRNVSNEELRRIFDDPRVHTGYGYHRVQDAGHKHGGGGGGGSGGKRRRTGEDGSAAAEDDRPPEDEKAALKAQVALLDAEIAALQRERLTASVALAEIERKERETAELAEKKRQEEVRRRREAAAAEARRQAEIEAAEAERRRVAAVEAEREARGNYCDYYVTDAKFVGKLWDGSTTKCVALGSIGNEDSETAVMMIYESGESAWSSGLPKGLHNKLNGRQRSLPAPTYIAMGTKGRYYLQFACGEVIWGGDFGDHEFDASVRRMNDVVCVAFGEYATSWFIVQSGGGYSYQGIPTALCDAVKKNEHKTIEHVSLGPKGEWWIRWEDGGSSASGMSDKCSKAWDKIANNFNIKRVLYGPDDDWFIRYS